MSYFSPTKERSRDLIPSLAVSEAPAADASLNQRNNFIQYLRGYAALMVVLDHSMLRLARLNARDRWMDTYAGDLGALGVEIFFVISGFIMVSIAYDAFGRTGATVKFWTDRLTRIAPLYYLATALVLILPPLLGGTSFAPRHIIASLLFLPTDARPDQGALAPVLGVGWTLNYEMFFYMLFGVSLLMPRRIGLGFTFATLFALVLLGQVLERTTGLQPRSLGYFYTFHIMLLFALGMLLGLWRRSRWFRVVHLPAPAEIGVGLCLIVLVALNMTMPGVYPIWRTSLFYAMSGLAVLLTIAAAPRPRRPFAELLGNASFSIYLFHGLALTLVALAWVPLFGFRYSFGRVAVSLLAGGGIGILAYRFVEQPIVRLLKPWSRQARTAS